jgi:hypothetical protein
MTREPLYAAIFAFFAGLTSGGAPLFKTATRDPKHWDECPREDQPALLLRPVSEAAEHRHRVPTKWTLEIELLLYVAKDDASTPANPIMNPLLDAIETALTPDARDGVCTLGGLVTYAAYSGPTQLHLGALGDEAVAIVPIRVLVTH